MRSASQSVTERESGSGPAMEAGLESGCEIGGGFEKSLKNLSVAVDRCNKSGSFLHLSKIGHPIALVAVSGEQLLKSDFPGGPGTKRKALR